MAQSTTNLDAALKVLYQGGLEDLTYPNNTLFALMPKKQDFAGKNITFPVYYGPAGGVGSGSNFSSIQGKISNTLLEDFVVTRAKEYSLARIETEALEASASDSGSFVRGLKHVMDDAIKHAANRVGQSLYGDGSGALGKVSSPGASSTLTLVNKDDIVNFYVGQQLVFAASISAALRDTGDHLTVETIDEDAGTMTISSTATTNNVNDIASIATNDIIFERYDYVSSSDKNRIKGCGAWLPASAPATSDSFFGVNRSAHASRLAGHRVTDTTLPIDEALRRGQILVRRGAVGVVSHIFLNPMQFEILEATAMARYNPTTVEAGKFRFRALEFGEAKVMMDYNCPVDRAYGLDMSSWCLHTLGGAPHVLGMGMGQGGVMPVYDADSVEIRIATFGNTICRRPGANFVCTLAAPS